MMKENHGPWGAHTLYPHLMITMKRLHNCNFLGKVANWQAETLINNKTEVSETECVWSLKIFLTQARKKNRFQVLYIPHVLLKIGHF